MDWSEIVFGSSDSVLSRRIHRAVQAGQLRKLASRIYTPNLQDAPEKIILRNLYPILGKLFPGAVLSHRSALEAGPVKLLDSTGHFIVLTYHYTKQFTLPGLSVRLVAGASAQKNDTLFMGELFIASKARALLENMQHSRGSMRKSLPLDAIESHLDKLCQSYGAEELNNLRDEARDLAQHLQMPREFKKLDQLMGSLLGTQSSEHLQTAAGQARALGLPYDTHRIELFTELASTTRRALVPCVDDTVLSVSAMKNAAFFEAYFSNYIEGTVFTIEEASDIVFQHKVIPHRRDDSHDVLGTYRIVVDSAQMRQVATTADVWIDQLKKRHFAMMGMRDDKTPGKFKQIVNREGNTIFVQPALVQGTLHKAFDIYQSVPKGLARAMLVMFIVSEVHPFLDGNGRIARIMMNAELAQAGESRIIIPTVYREDYLLAIRRLTKTGDPAAYIKMLTTAQAFTQSLCFDEFDQALKQLHQSNAMLEPYEGKLKF